MKADDGVAAVASGEVLAKASRLFPVISTNQLPLRIGANTGHDAGNRFVGEHTFTLNDEMYHVVVERVGVVPQALSGDYDVSPAPINNALFNPNPLWPVFDPGFKDEAGKPAG